MPEHNEHTANPFNREHSDATHHAHEGKTPTPLHIEPHVVGGEHTSDGEHITELSHYILKNVPPHQSAEAHHVISKSAHGRHALEEWKRGQTLGE